MRSTLRSILFTAVTCVFLAGNVAAAEQVTATAAGAFAAKATISLQLHTSPHTQSSAHGLRQSAPEEVQRIEELGARQKFARENNVSAIPADDGPVFFSASQCLKPLLLVEIACSRANLISFAHAYLTARYPIPPPLASR